MADVLRRTPARSGKRLLVALSGGPDSVAILHALYRLRARLKFELAAAHFNHGIRALESDRDEQFVRGLCGRLQVELIVDRGPALKPGSLEEQARELRYDFLSWAASTLNADLIVLGHHRDDQAETVLLRLLRGAGVAGAAAMAESGPGRLLRPLLSVERAEILDYLRAIGAEYVVDSSNFEPVALRNRVRSDLLPSLDRDYSPGIARRLAQFACELSDLNSFIEAEACHVLSRALIRPADMSDNRGWGMKLPEFQLMHAALMRAVMRELIRRCIGNLRGIERAHIDGMCRLVVDKAPSRTLTLPRGWRFRREYDTVMLEHEEGLKTDSLSDGGRPEIELMPGENALPFGASTISVRQLFAGDAGFPVAPWHPVNSAEAYFDAAKIASLTARSFRPGDRIRPLGLSGCRKVHDVFVDHKLTIAHRRSWPLVLSGEEVIWIPRLVRSSAALVTAESQKVLHLRADSLAAELKLRLPEL